VNEWQLCKILKFLFLSNNVFKAAQNIKENLDVKYGPTWHVIVGEGFSFDITYEVNKSVNK
jgi:dynein light chain 4